ncbi:MAG: bifunctional nuclease family protein [Anaerolineae bacterium]|nr:MAG: bifunctional nuclease family protein [Anaerolineae bacterium]
MVKVTIDSIRVSLMSQQRIIILREENSDRYLPIWIGIFEAEAIAIALQEVEVSRPLTHDLLRNVLRRLGAQVLRVEVVALQDDTYYGNIVLDVQGERVEIDSRPSDALALAVRVNAPIYVARAVLDAAGIVPEEDINVPPKPAAAPAPPPPPPEESEERLSIFEDFLEKLDIDDEDEKEE